MGYNVMSVSCPSRVVLHRIGARWTVFVCTGNTCRSPLAEGLCKKLLAERLGCPAEELPQRGFLVISAGIAAMMGGEAAAEAERWAPAPAVVAGARPAGSPAKARTGGEAAVAASGPASRSLLLTVSESAS